MRDNLFAFLACGLAASAAFSGAAVGQTTAERSAQDDSPIARAIDSATDSFLEAQLRAAPSQMNTRLTAAVIGARDGVPCVTQSFEYWLSLDHVEAMHNLGALGGLGVFLNRDRFAATLPDAICAALDAEAMEFFRTGASLRVVVTVRAQSLVRSAADFLELADVTIHGCGVS